MRTTHTATDNATSIKVEGMEAEAVRLLHVADSHLGLIDERDAEHLEACAGTSERFGTRRLDAEGSPVFPETTLDEMMEEVALLGRIDLLAHTGDFIHFPSQANVERAVACLTSTGLEFIYTAGNHDWHFPGVEDNGGLREACWPLLDPLTDGQPSHQARDIGGIRFIAVDNSTYQITEEQLEFFTGQLAAGLPTVLFMHIPVSLPTLRPPTIAKWKTPLLMADPAGDSAYTGTATTVEFARSLTAAANLVAIFCGHVHFEHIDSVSPNAAQYVGVPAFETGRSRLIEFQPF